MSANDGARKSDDPTLEKGNCEEVGYPEGSGDIVILSANDGVAGHESPCAIVRTYKRVFAIEQIRKGVI